MTSGPIFFHTNIDDAEIDNTCPRKYYNAKIEGAQGLTPKSEVLEAEMVKATLSDLRDIGGMRDLDVYVLERLVSDLMGGMTAAHRADKQGMEMFYRRVGLMCSYALYVEPYLRRFFETVEIPAEIILTRSPLMIRVQTGRLLKNRQTGELFYREFVPTTASGSSKWKSSWEYSVRPQLSIAAIQQCLKQQVTAAQVMGVGMGYRSVLSSNAGLSVAHPYVQAYFNADKNEWTHLFRTQSEGWEPRPVWEWPGTIVQWVVKCGKDVAASQFPLSARVGFNRGVLDSWVEHRLHRERVIWSNSVEAATSKYMLSMHFPMFTKACMPLYEVHCPFLMKCWTQKKEEGLKDDK